MATESIQALIIGAGVAGERHAKSQKKLGSQVAVYDINYRRAQEVGESVGAQAFGNVDEALEWSNLVFIATPDDRHTDYALASIEKGRAVYSEKPVTTSLSDALVIQQEVNEHGTVFVAGANYRLTRAFESIWERATRGDYGELTMVGTTYEHDMRAYHRRTPWRRNQDFLYGGGIHAIDLAMWIAQERVVSVQGMTGKNLIEDYTQPEVYAINLTFESGLLGQVRLNARSPQPRHGTELVVQGSRGRTSAHNKYPTVHDYHEGMTFPDPRKARYQRKSYPDIPTFDRASEIVNGYLLGEREDHTPLPDIHEAVEVIRVIDAIDQSIHKGQTVILNNGRG